MPTKKKPMRQKEFYCVSCKKRVMLEHEDICFHDGKSSKRRKIPMLKGHCSKCDCKVFKFVKQAHAGDLRKKYSRC